MDGMDVGWVCKVVGDGWEICGGENVVVGRGTGDGRGDEGEGMGGG